MPTKRKYRDQLRRDKELTEERITHFMLGYSFFEDKPFKDNEERREIWFKYRDELLKMNLERRGFFGSHPDRGGPGTRPAAWWDYEAKEPRRLISGECEPHDDKLWFGTIAHISRAVNPVWETQAEYLERLGLLEEWETTAIAEGGEQVDVDKLDDFQYP